MQVDEANDQRIVRKRGELDICTNIKFDFQKRTWTDHSVSDFEALTEKWETKKGFPSKLSIIPEIILFIFYLEKYSIEKPCKIGPFWENFEGLLPLKPYQPEFVSLQITKYESATISLSGAFMHSDNDLFASAQNSSTFEHLKNWYKCNGKTGFMVDTIHNANATCQKMNSTIQTFLSKVLKIEIFKWAILPYQYAHQIRHILQYRP